MKETSPVHVAEALNHLKHHLPHFLIRKHLMLLSPPLNQLIEIHIEKLKDEVEDILMTKHFLQLYYIWMLQLKQGFHLWVRHSILPRRILLFELLHG